MKRDGRRVNSREQTVNAVNTCPAIEKLRAAGSVRVVATALGISPAMLSSIQTGKREASAEVREKARERYGVEASDWQGAGAAPAFDAPHADRGPRARLVDALREYDRMLASELTLGARVATMRARDACAERLARLDGITITESTIIRHPAMQRVIERLNQVLAVCPLCHRRATDLFVEMADGANPGGEGALRRRYPALVADLERAQQVLDEECMRRVLGVEPKELPAASVVQASKEAPDAS